ncbi:tRNA 5-methoxyuridine(34)/uridine 5-oxyacetic acid(34) synthase CmoB [Stieleria mannarensis]|uniref:tRNA 5-methoxyuridine(34)/uridine 5-oxyacetic acid(34) synthase CmoB n=1 Tax=Stieleria mannarensis TaxID=2755585 RepID=UPI0015FFE33C|nr:tRNA 5-methoxyuridine(34)/uridine 5-oxyacetic acid(34) synthase CmoB [Rhodopirellula sp. JC639]
MPHTTPAIPNWFDRRPLDQWLRQRGHDAFADSVTEICARRLHQPTNGDLKRWVSALEALPSAEGRQLVCRDGRVAVVGPAAETTALRETLMAFHPWRKGPFDFLDLTIDTEWRSDWKWDRIAHAIDLSDKSVLDVGCGNGYYGWRMLEAGASIVMGIDPILRFLMQFEVFNRYQPTPRHNFVVPMVDTDLPEKLGAFDVVFSAGVLYHRTSPIDHLRSLNGALAPGGELVLETLIIDDDHPDNAPPGVLVPEDRYAQMRNVWFIPSLAMLRRWIRRTGFEDIQTVDITATDTSEQRSTDWMTFQSLADFLDADDPSKTVEGYPGPVRATVVAKKKAE